MVTQTHIRISPTGQVAQRVPDEARNTHMVENKYSWVAFSWPEGQLTMQLMTDDEVADWHVASTEDADGAH